MPQLGRLRIPPTAALPGTGIQISSSLDQDRDEEVASFEMPPMFCGEQGMKYITSPDPTETLPPISFRVPVLATAPFQELGEESRSQTGERHRPESSGFDRS
jgi:hypothetical protein